MFDGSVGDGMWGNVTFLEVKQSGASKNQVFVRVHFSRLAASLAATNGAGFK